MKNKGFTLVELLIVIAIIGILAAIALFGVSDALKRSRDAQRKSDLKQLQALVEAYANKNNNVYYKTYPLSGSTICSTLDNASAPCPSDPISGRYYHYRPKADGSGYALYADMEDDHLSKNYFTICSDGKADYYSSVPSVDANGLLVSCFP